MNDLWNSIMIIFGILISVIIYLNCKMWYKEYRKFRHLSNSSNIRSSQIYPLPIAEAIPVYNMNEDLHIIDLQ